MRKKKVIKPHEIKPDPKFGSITVSKLINKVMRNGEKRKAREIVYQAAAVIEKWFKEQPAKQKKEEKIAQGVVEAEKEEKKIPSEMEQVKPANQTAETDQEKETLKTTSSPFLTVLEGALTNIKPGVEMKRKKQGSASYRIPKIIDEVRALKIALRWLVEGAKERKEKGKKSPRPMFEMFENLAEEIKSAYINDKDKPSEAFKRKENLYKEAESGRVFSSNR